MKLITDGKIKISKIEIDVNKQGHVTNCYFYQDKNNNLVIIDPAGDYKLIKSNIENMGINLKGIFLTHLHADHIGALHEFLNEFETTPVYIHELDKKDINKEDINCKNIVNMKIRYIDENRLIEVHDKTHIKIGDMEFEIISTPGHTKGCICILEKASNTLITGDTVFSNTYGRTDLFTGNSQDMRQSLNELFERFDEILCLSGHGEEFILKEAKKKINLLFAYKEGC